VAYGGHQSAFDSIYINLIKGRFIMKKKMNSKLVELVVPAAIFLVPIALLVVTFTNTGRF
jgi:hypothetical protein